MGRLKFRRQTLQFLIHSLTYHHRLEMGLMEVLKKKKSKTRKLEIERNKTNGDLDYSSPLSFEVASKHSPYETVSTGDSNNSTPLCAINPTRYSQSTSTPISSQLAGEPSTWLFSKISQEHTTNSSDNSKNNIHKSNVRAGDS